MIQQKRGKTPGLPPELTVTTMQGQQETIRDRQSVRILGLNVQKNLTWRSHLETGLKPLLPGLRKNLGALRSLGRQIPQGSRNTMAIGILLKQTPVPDRNLGRNIRQHD